MGVDGKKVGVTRMAVGSQNRFWGLIEQTDGNEALGVFSGDCRRCCRADNFCFKEELFVPDLRMCEYMEQAR